MDDQPLVRVRVWDGWIRLVHWSIVILLGLSWWSIEAGRMRLHYLSGYAVLTLVLFRIAWGFLGSDTARFGRFLRSPLAALRHLAHLPRREPDREVGHNAAGGWMVLVLLALLLAQPVTGLFADSGYGDHGPLAKAVAPDTSDWLTGLHHRNFNLILAAAGLHVLAVLAYALVKRHDLVRPMVLGWKRLPAGLPAPRLGSPRLAAALLGAAALAVYGVSRLG
ncbi:cytochrome b/b6 domain-containing protein [Roseicella aerolata]|uniref:Cytochrome b/b6 domain-containing protein n=1 Tax=Roseicella aerolata TaxID=2883479 RepID=A0A9X1I8Z3_9PROT|nr:cytochrome b/b6 domain-containing protein [Roseicella aerolata]MCB4820470.1 cytochrome b/b6 domain-containing protein [Roseicella aerolata]